MICRWFSRITSVPHSYPLLLTIVFLLLTSRTAKADCSGGPVVTNQPSDQAACPGSTVSFTVGASGIGLTYAWRHVYQQFLPDGGTFSGTTTPTLTVSRFDQSANGWGVDCLISGCSGQAITTEAYLMVLAEPQISMQPTSQTVCAGESVSFTVVGLADLYQWQENGAALVDGGTVSGSSTPTLTLTGVDLGDGGSMLSCVLSSTNNCGPAVTSTSATLSVVSGRPVITTEPQSQTVCDTCNATFSVVATNAARYTWRKNGASLSNGDFIIGADTPTLTVAGAGVGDTGVYDVVVVGDAPCQPVISSPAILAVIQVPTTVTAIHQFGSPYDGFWPYGGVVQGADGNFYGTTTLGNGSHMYGIVFRISPTGDYKILHDFKTSEGLFPYLRLVQGTDGYFYGVTSQNGPGNSGSIFKISPTGTFSVVYGSGFRSGLVQGRDGYFYGVLNLNVFKMDTNGVVTTVGACDCDPHAPLVQASDGNFYGASYIGGSNGTGFVFMMTPAGALTKLYHFDAAGGPPTAGIVVGNDGNFYGTTRLYYLSAGLHETIFKISPAGAFTVLKTFSASASGDPQGPLVLGSDGFFYGAAGGIVYKISTTGVFRVLFYTTPSDSTSGLVQGHDGCFYGTTTPTDSQHGYGAVFKFTAPLGQIPDQICAVQATNADVVVALPSVAGETYQLQIADLLTGGVWSNDPNASVTNCIGGSLTLTNYGGAVSPQRFYRLAITP